MKCYIYADAVVLHSPLYMWCVKYIVAIVYLVWVNQAFSWLMRER
jgi:hypothetical protein